MTFSNFMCETLLIVPVNNVVALVTTMLVTLAAPTLFEFLMSFFVLLGLQVVDRVYMSPNQDYVVSSVAQVFVRVFRFASWLLSGASQRQEEEIIEEMDSDDDDGEAPDDEPEAQAEDMIGFLAGYSTDLVCTFLSPVFLILCTWVYEESQYWNATTYV